MSICAFFVVVVVKTMVWLLFAFLTSWTCFILVKLNVSGLLICSFYARKDILNKDSPIEANYRE